MEVRRPRLRLTQHHRHVRHVVKIVEVEAEVEVEIEVEIVDVVWLRSHRFRQCLNHFQLIRHRLNR